MEFRLLERFRGLFEGRKYLHRASTAGDSVAVELYEDLFNLGKSPKFVSSVVNAKCVVNRQNKRRGIISRRGDGSFGELIPGNDATHEPEYSVGRGPIATIEIGVEVKILAKAMIKQIDRVISDLQKQVSHFRAGGDSPICVGIVGINAAPYTTSYEGDRAYLTDGKKHKHPATEAADAEYRLVQRVSAEFDEFVILRYKALNESPFPFEWVDSSSSQQDYAAALTRISRKYETKF